MTLHDRLFLRELPPHLEKLVRLAVDGHTNRHIQAQQMGYSYSTVKNLWSRIYKLTGLRDQTAVVVWAFPQVQHERVVKQQAARVAWLQQHNARRIHDAVAEIRARREAEAATASSVDQPA